MFINIPDLNKSQHLPWPSDWTPHASSLLADAALITGEKKKEVAGCSNDEAKEVAMVAAEKSPRPTAAGWSWWPVTRQWDPKVCISWYVHLRFLLLDTWSVLSLEIRSRLPVPWWMKPLAMAPMLFTKSHNICKQCHVRRRMVLYGSIQPKRKDKRTSAQMSLKCVHWSRGPARIYHRLSYANEPQMQHLFPCMTCCRKRMEYSCTCNVRVSQHPVTHSCRCPCAAPIKPCGYDQLF